MPPTLRCIQPILYAVLLLGALVLPRSSRSQPPPAGVHPLPPVPQDNGDRSPAESLPAPPLPGSDEIDLDMVIYAGGAVEFHVPNGWRVTEVPSGRELRLWLTPKRIADSQRPQAGIWMAYQWLGRRASSDEIEQWLSNRVPNTAGGTSGSDATQHLLVDGKQASLREYHEGNRASLHVAIAMSHGIFEFSLVCGSNDFDVLRATTMSVLESMVLGTPQPRRHTVGPRTADAANVTGLWKGLRGRLRIGGDGRFVVNFDSDKNFPLDESGNVDLSRSVSQLTGRYHAEDDMIFVKWDDGSRLNYRWRLDNGRLLLTDHNGRVSQLHRLVQ